MKISKLTIAAFCLAGVCPFAQNQQLEEKLMALKQNQANNKQKLAQYTWTETDTVSLKGDGPVAANFKPAVAVSLGLCELLGRASACFPQSHGRFHDRLSSAENLSFDGFITQSSPS
jgi:hypothetical protein